MVEIGHALSSEEHDPKSLVRQGQLPADAGFDAVRISGHLHSWLDE